ncbi:hypothetical protein BDV95DRAFT_614175 [Massariosphaeria phaeospora]|uniref:SnoaL-like domain-containing protein n=1 Tax=Massariosphaeria phaeospora TaxID=100035 RepID=A0A7C8MCF8_9PLEO|nr:hypothetical protein BDV95DRAFT_614175 [Massariosphaeria phaeospora]
MTARSTAISLTRSNLTSIFSEPNANARLSAIQQLWAPSGDCLFIDALGVFKSHQAISDMVEKILGMGSEGDVFTELDEVDVLSWDEEQDLWVTRVKWGTGAPGGEFKLKGWDVVTIVGGKIKACYTFLET